MEKFSDAQTSNNLVAFKFNKQKTIPNKKNISASSSLVSENINEESDSFSINTSSEIPFTFGKNLCNRDNKLKSIYNKILQKMKNTTLYIIFFIKLIRATLQCHNNIKNKTHMHRIGEI